MKGCRGRRERGTALYRVWPRWSPRLVEPQVEPQAAWHPKAGARCQSRGPLRRRLPRVREHGAPLEGRLPRCRGRATGRGAAPDAPEHAARDACATHAVHEMPGPTRLADGGPTWRLPEAHLRRVLRAQHGGEVQDGLRQPAGAPPHRRQHVILRWCDGQGGWRSRRMATRSELAWCGQGRCGLGHAWTRLSRRCCSQRGTRLTSPVSAAPAQYSPPAATPSPARPAGGPPAAAPHRPACGRQTRRAPR